MNDDGILEPKKGIPSANPVALERPNPSFNANFGVNVHTSFFPPAKELRDLEEVHKGTIEVVLKEFQENGATRRANETTVVNMRKDGAARALDLDRTRLWMAFGLVAFLLASGVLLVALGYQVGYVLLGAGLVPSALGAFVNMKAMFNKKRAP